MIDELIYDFNNFNPESFNMKLNHFKFNCLKRIIVQMTLNRIYDLYSCESMYCNKEMVRTALIKRMQIQYLYQ